MDYDHYDSPLGPLLMAADGGGLSQLWLPNEVIARVIPTDWRRCGAPAPCSMPTSPKSVPAGRICH